ncbi:Sulfotransferase 1 family member D1 [Araneus ventricosus]|uniref:Sulfotransferase 1 family member D1 n=1 Tax=Araneus ventricosus TaxID=182803 RepID=A0A4Y2A9M8_ARAVE|nr:Sulfotransferase 1 family member D1 [Araneus ventricosus]
MTRPGAIKTHLPYHLTPRSEEAKYIYVTRNPKDCCVSYYHHMKSIPGHGFNGTFDQFFELFISGRIDYGDYFDHLLAWYKHRKDPNVLFMTYEEMKENPETAVLKMASFLDEEKFAKPLKDYPEKLSNVLKSSVVEVLVVAPILWNIYIKAILNLNNDQHYIQAFADDLALGTAGGTRRELESNTNCRLHLIYDKLQELKLELSVDKCQGIAIRSYQNSNHQRTGQSVFNWSPCFKLNGKSIRIRNALKYLGINIDNSLPMAFQIFLVLLLLLNALRTFDAAVAEIDSDPAVRWENFKKTYQKIYDAEEEEMRRKNFEENYRKISEHNQRYEQGMQSFHLGFNVFADMVQRNPETCLNDSTNLAGDAIIALRINK